MGKGVRASARLWWWIGGAVLLAAVIFAGAALSAPQRNVKSGSTNLSPQVRAQRLATQAETAISRNDTDTARTLAEQALALDSTNEAAKRVTVRVKKRPAAPATPTESTSTAAPGVYDKVADDLATMLPAAIEGWRPATTVVQGGEGLVTFEPDVRNADLRSASRVTFAVHDRSDSSKAAAFIDAVDRKAYPSGGSTEKVGVATGYAGNDGRAVHVFAFARGRFAFEVMVAAQPGVSADLRPLVLRLAAASPATR